VLETRATRYICTNKDLFQNFEEAKEENIVYMGNFATTRVHGNGKVLLKLTSRKMLSLNNVLYVLDMCGNLVFGAFLNKAGLKIILQVDKVVLTKNGEFVGKGYFSGGLFILNTVEMHNNATKSAYVVESLDLWHGRLGHVNIVYIKISYLS